MNNILLFVQAFTLNSTAKICRFFDICKYFYKFFSSFLQINFYVFVFQRVANIERKKKIRPFYTFQIDIYICFYIGALACLGCLRFYRCLRKCMGLRFCMGYLSKNAPKFTLQNDKPLNFSTLQRLFEVKL